MSAHPLRSPNPATLALADEEGNGHGPGSDLDALKAWLVTSVMFDPSQDDETLIATFLEAYYSPKVAPFIRLYMDTMHGSIADTEYYMRENFDEHAAFLTPLAVLTAAEALTHARTLTAPGSRYRERVDVAKLAIYYPMLLRWEEMAAFAKSETLPWPLLETTKDQALQWFLGFGGQLDPPLTHLNEPGTHNLSWFAAEVGRGGAPARGGRD